MRLLRCPLCGNKLHDTSLVGHVCPQPYLATSERLGPYPLPLRPLPPRGFGQR